MNEEIKTPTTTIERMWDVVKTLDYSRWSATWFKSISIEGDLVILNVLGRNIHRVMLDLREHEEDGNVEYILKRRFPNWTNPPGFKSAVRFGPYIFIICASQDY